MFLIYNVQLHTTMAQNQIRQTIDTLRSTRVITKTLEERPNNVYCVNSTHETQGAPV